MEAFDLLPWPLQLGLIGGLIVVIISLVIRRERAISRGDLVPRATHERELARADKTTEQYRLLWEVADKRGDKLEEVAEDVVSIGEELGQFLKSVREAAKT